MIQALLGIASHSVALVLYPGLATMIVFGLVVELAWTRSFRRDWERPSVPRRRPTPVEATIALCALVAAVQVAAPWNPVAPDERNVVLAAAGLAFTAWAELALTVEFVAAPGLTLIVQACWLLAVLGPAVQPESLRPQVLGNVLVPGLLPVKIACAFLYLLCLPALLRMWPFAPPSERRARRRLDGARIVTWFPYCALFTTLFVPPQPDDPAGLARFVGATLGVAAITLAFGALLRWRGAAVVRGLYSRVVTTYGVIVVAIVIVTSIVMR